MRATFLALVLALTLLTIPALAQQPPLFVTNQDFAPYSMIVNGRPSGIDVDVIMEASKRAGIPINLAMKPWAQVVSMVENGECEAAFSLFHTPERERYAMYMEAVPVHYSDYVLFTKVGSKLDFKSYNDLSGTIIGRVNGTDLGKEFAAALKAKTLGVKDYPDQAAAILGMLQGETDAFAGNIDVTYNRLKAMGMASSITYQSKKIVTGKPSYLVFSRASDHPDKELILQKLERALDVMVKDGTYNKIARKYLLRF